MKKILFCILLNIVSVFSIFASETINPEWIKEDETIIQLALDFIKNEDFTDIKIKKLINKNKVIDIESHNQGFGLQKFSGSLPGGYLSIYITYISYNNEPCKLIFNMDKDDLDEIQKYINKKLLKNFLKNFSHTKNIYDRDIYCKVVDFSDINKKFLNHKKNIIGDIKDISLPKAFQKYYDFLYYCENETEYGYIGGIAAEKPMGREAMEELVKLNNKQIFINLLKGDNPCGRIYAAEGLLRLENSEENIKIINIIFSPLIEEGITYSTIGGCIVISGVKYKLYTYDENLSFPEINKNLPTVYDEDAEVEPLEFDLDFLKSYDE